MLILKWAAIIVMSVIAAAVAFVVLFNRYVWWIGFSCTVSDIRDDVIASNQRGRDGIQVRLTDRRTRSFVLMTKSIRKEKPTAFHMQFFLTGVADEKAAICRKLLKSMDAEQQLSESNAPLSAHLVWTKLSKQPEYCITAFFHDVLGLSSDARLRYQARGNSDLFSNQPVGWPADDGSSENASSTESGINPDTDPPQT